jgi:glutamate/tyrosine decarboxylase-like PLP-dependent enzyme
MTQQRSSSIEINSDEFRKIGHALIERIAHFLEDIYDHPVTSGKTGSQIREILNTSSLRNEGINLSELLPNTADILFDHSLFNGHPKFMGYITSSPAPAGILADLLAAAVNPNVGAQILSPVATEIEKDAVRWLTEFIGLNEDYAGILVSGGNMANFTGFLAARTAKGPGAIKSQGMKEGAGMVVYCAKSTHTWIEKAVVLFGLGTDAIRWIPTTFSNKMNIPLLEAAIEKDLNDGLAPSIVVGTAGDVSTGAVDDLEAIGKICDAFDLWFHVDGAYGVPAVASSEAEELFKGLDKADSIALDPHKWLYAPLEAGCTLVKNPAHLTNTFSSHPEYYKFDRDEMNFYEYGLQNSRGFRALKVWIQLQQVGKSGYQQLITEDIQLARYMYELADQHPELEAFSHHLSITVFRYNPGKDMSKEQLDELNSTLLERLQKGGEVFLSNAVIRGSYCLRACIVNFRTSARDIEETIEIVVREGQKLHR